MNIVRKIHDLFRVKTVAGAQLETPKAVSSLEAGGSTFITITGGGGGTSLSGSGLSELDRIKLDSIELGALVNLDAFSKLLLDASNIDENDLISNSNSTIIANVPTDTANIKIVGNYPITVNLESVSLFNSNTSTTTGTTITTYNISFNDSNNIVIEYVDGALLNVADVELIQVKHKEDILATYQLSDITHTTSDGTITSFTIPYSNTDFSEIEFCKYETVTTETELGSTTVRELRVLSTLPASPTKLSIITLKNIADNFWNYEEDENGNKFVWTDYNVYSTKDVSAYGRGTDLGDIYASNLYELKDVVLTNLSNNDLLIYNSSTSKWVNVNKDLLGISAGADTYTKAEVDSKILIVSNKLDDFLTGSDTDDIINKWKELELFLAGYTETLTLAELLSIKANSSITITAGTGLTGGGDLTQDRTISLATSDVAAGIYTKVTVDIYGRVTSGGVLTTTDIPDLDWSKITTGKPTTLEGYGITDGISSIVLDGDGNAITEASVNDRVLVLIKGATYLSLSTFDDMFEKVNIGTESEPKYAIKAKYGFYSVGEITAYGLNDNEKTTYTTLAELDDVLISNPAIGDLLKYNGTKWVNAPMSQMVVDAYTKSEMDNKLATITDIIEDVQRLTNRQVTFWFFEYDPTTTNYPASEWTTNEEKLKHEEDMFYNSTNGKVWRWKLNDSSQYEWSLITDADTLRALELVEIAQNTANQKKRNFTTTPTSDDAYDVGDLWSNATYGASYDNDLLVCVTAKTAGTDFSISHWLPIGKVTSSYISGQIQIINNSINELDTRVRTAETNTSTALTTANNALTKATTNESTLTTITSEVSALNSRISSEVNTLNSRIDTEVKTLLDQLDTIFSWFAFENSCIKAKYSLFSVGEITAHKTS